jgi:hypothetical protein
MNNKKYLPLIILSLCFSGLCRISQFIGYQYCIAICYAIAFFGLYKIWETTESNKKASFVLMGLFGVFSIVALFFLFFPL